MDEIVLRCRVRDERGKSACRRLRVRGVIPAVLYGRKEPTIPVQVSAQEFAKVFSAIGGRTALLSLLVQGDGTEDKETVIIKEVQQDSITDRVLNVDFMRVSEAQRLTISVPVRLVGDAAGVEEGGVLEQVAYELEVECPATAIPESLEVDVSHLAIGDSLSAQYVKLPSEVKLFSSPEEVVATVVPPTVVEVPVEEEIVEPELVGEEVEEEVPEEPEPEEEEE